MMRVFKMHKAGVGRRPPTPLRVRPREPDARAAPDGARADAGAAGPARPDEIGGPTGPEPTRYGDWERKGICYDF
jgi:hypothetical protein